MAIDDPAIYEFENEPPVSEEALARRYAILERGHSHDGTQTWLKWVIRLPSGEVAGYVQATVLKAESAYVAYEPASRYLGRRIRSTAVRSRSAVVGLLDLSRPRFTPSAQRGYR